MSAIHLYNVASRFVSIFCAALLERCDTFIYLVGQIMSFLFFRKNKGLTLFCFVTLYYCVSGSVNIQRVPTERVAAVEMKVIAK